MDPHRLQAAGSCRFVIVIEALGDVEELVGLVAQRLEGIVERIEVGGGRLVGPDVFGRDRRIELDAEVVVAEPK